MPKKKDPMLILFKTILILSFLCHSGCSGDGGTMGGHRYWSIGLLFDNISDIGDTQLQLRNRGDFGTHHGWSTANSTIWNSKNTPLIVQNRQRDKTMPFSVAETW